MTKNCLLIGLITLLVSGCASYRAQTLSKLSPQTAAYSEQKENITVSCKAFTKQDCERYLDRDVIAKGFQPIQITIENDSDHAIIFSKNNVSLPCADVSYVAEQVHTSTVARATAYGVGALFLWPLAIPAIVDGVKSSNANDALNRDFASKTTDQQLIPAHSTLNGLVFIPIESFYKYFSMTLVDKSTKEKVVFTPNLS